MEQYKKAYKRVVRSAIFNATVYTTREADKHDFASPPEITAQIVAHPDLESWFLGDSPLTNAEVKTHFEGLINQLRPDVIIFEQPYLYISISEILAELKLTIPLIYSSHNIESQMMLDIFTDLGKSQIYAPQLAELEDEERQLSQVAAGVISVTDHDAEVIRAWGSINVLVQGNGADVGKSSAQKRWRVNRMMKRLKIDSYALFVASSHRPNVDGFMTMVGSRLGFIPSNSMIFLAGDIASALQPEIERVDPEWGSLFWSRVYNWGRVSKSTLAALISEANCLILPVTTGGGSNLKTAQAILSGNRIVGTPKAFRGYSLLGPFQSRILLAEEPLEFKKNLAVSLGRESNVTKINSGREDASERWDQKLAGINTWIREIGSNSQAERSYE